MVCKSECRLLQRPEKSPDPLGLESQVTVSYPTLVHGAVCQSSARAECAFNHRAISLAQYKFLKPLYDSNSLLPSFIKKL